MLAVSIRSTVIDDIPKNDITRDLALRVVAKWDYAYRYLDEELKDKEIISVVLNHGKSGYDIVSKHHPEGESVLTKDANTVCAMKLIAFADSQDKRASA